MTQPAGQDRKHPVLMAFGDEQESRGAGPAIEIFIATTHREIGLAVIQRHRHGSRAVAEIPDHRDAKCLGPGRHSFHVV